MSSNQTPVYGLNQWSLEDQVIMNEFNADNAKIEQALLDLKAAMPKIATGSYVGTGTGGPDHPNTLEFDFTPQLIIIIVEDEKPTTLTPWTFVRPWKYCTAYRDGNASSNTSYNYVTWLDNGISWYSQYNNGNPAPNGQLNTEGQTYHYLAIG